MLVAFQPPVIPGGGSGLPFRAAGKQVRLGSRFADVESAQRVAQAFKAMLCKEPKLPSITLNVRSTKLNKFGWGGGRIKQLTCRFYKTKTNTIGEELVLSYLQRWVKGHVHPSTGHSVRARETGWSRLDVGC